VPLYGDMQFSLEQTIKRCPHYDEKTWGPGLEDKKLALEYEIQDQIDGIRTEYNMYLAKFTGMIHQVPLPASQAPYYPLRLYATAVMNTYCYLSELL
jgi:hypothetical protein